MPAAARRSRTAGAPSSRNERRSRRSRRPALREYSLEHRILLTATLCLLAFGAVMVYSASSATTLLRGHGYGSGYRVKFLVYGGLVLVPMRLLPRAVDAQAPSR